MPLVDLDPLPETYAGLKSHCLVDEMVLTSQLKEWGQDLEGEDVDGGALGVKVKNDLIGQLSGKIKASGHLSLERGHSGAKLRQRLGRNKPVCALLAPQGLAVGKPTIIQPSRIKNGSVKGDEKETVRIDAEMNAAGIFLDGVMLVSPRTPFSGATWTSTIDINLDDFESIDGLTKFGGLFQAHLLGFEGGTNPTATASIEQSADDGETFTNLASLAAMSKPGALFKKVQSVIQVQPQLQVKVVTTGAPTAVQMAISFGRGLDPEA